MVRKFRKEWFALDFISDLVLIYLSYILVVIFTGKIHPSFDVRNISMTIHPLAELFSILLGTVYVSMGVYHQSRYHGRRKVTAKIIFGNLIGILIIASFLYLVRVVDFSRFFFFLFAVVCTAIICLKHFCVATFFARVWMRGKNLYKVIVLGSNSLAEQYVSNVEAHPEFGYTVVGNIGEKAIPNVKYLGKYQDIDELLNNPEIDEVVVCPESTLENIDLLIGKVEKAGIPCSIIPSFNNSLSAKVSVDLLGDMKVIALRDNPLDNPFNAFIKRLEDIVLSLVFIILSSPFMLIALIGVRVSSPGPILFRQERVGYHRKNFKMLKFRSMRINAQSDTAWSTGVDNRRTKFGSFIRKTSIDELPQFFNVLKGDMSIIGPRPEIPHFVDEFRESIPKYMVKHQVKPGITGWAQVHGFRGDTSIEGRIKYDIFYIEHWSLWLDIKIIFMTVFGGMINKEQL